MSSVACSSCTDSIQFVTHNLVLLCGGQTDGSYRVMRKLLCVLQTLQLESVFQADPTAWSTLEEAEYTSCGIFQKSQKKFSCRKQAHLEMEPNQTGTTTRYAHTISTFCVILLTPPTMKLCTLAYSHPVHNPHFTHTNTFHIHRQRTCTMLKSNM